MSVRFVWCFAIAPVAIAAEEASDGAGLACLDTSALTLLVVGSEGNLKPLLRPTKALVFVVTTFG